MKRGRWGKKERAGRKDKNALVGRGNRRGERWEVRKKRLDKEENRQFFYIDRKLDKSWNHT